MMERILRVSATLSGLTFVLICLSLLSGLHVRNADASPVGGLGGLVGGATGSAGAAGALGAAAGGIAGTATGTVSGTVSGSLGGPVAGAAGAAGAAMGNVGAALSGPAGTITSGASSAAGFGGGSLGIGTSLPVTSPAEAMRFSNALFSRSMRSAMSLMARQRVIGVVDAVGPTFARVRLADGSETVLSVTGEMADALRPYLNKTVMLRTADGQHVLSFVGRDDVVRATVAGVDGNTVSLISPSGEVFVMTIAPKAGAWLHVGARVIAQSHDYGSSALLSVLNIAPRSELGDVYVGQLAHVGSSSLTLRFGTMLQTFNADATLRRTAAHLNGKTVAIVAPDGNGVKSFLAAPTLTALLGAAQSGDSSGTRAVVLAATRNYLMLQLPNGDVRSFTGPVAAASLRSGATTHFAPLDAFHVRVQTNSGVAKLADVDACATLNARCKTSMNGNAVAVTASSLAVRFPSGDVATFLGDVLPSGAAPGLPVTVTPLNSTHARVAVAGKVLDLLDASACVTINSGCQAMTGAVTSTGRGTMSVRFADGSTATLSGVVEGADLRTNDPIIVQPLNSSHAVVQIGSTIGNLVAVNGCATLNASCSTSGGNLPGSTPFARRASGFAVASAGSQVHGNQAGGTACATLNVNGQCSSNSPAAGNAQNGGHLAGATGVASSGASARGNQAAGTACAELNASGQCSPATSATSGRGNRIASTTLVSGRANAMKGAANGNLSGCAGVNTQGSPCAAPHSTSSSVSPAGTNSGGAGNNSGGAGNNNGAAGGAGNGAAGGTSGGNGVSGPSPNGPQTTAGLRADAASDRLTGEAQLPIILALAFNGATTCSGDGQAVIQVADAVTGTPLAGARVRLDGATSAGYTTGDDGIVGFFHLASGDYTAAVAREGYKPLASPKFRLDCLGSRAITFALEPVSKKLRQAIKPSVSFLRMRRYTTTSVAALFARGGNACVAQGRRAHEHTLCAAKNLADR